MNPLLLWMLAALLVVALAFHGHNAQAADGDPVCIEETGECYPTISDAIDEAEPGQTIRVAPGIYYEQITIDKPLTLLGAKAGVDPRFDKRLPGDGESIIDGRGQSGNIVEISASDVTIDGFEITGAGHLSSDNLVYAFGDSSSVLENVVISHNLVHGHPGNEGIKVGHADGPIVEYNVVYDGGGDAINFHNVTNGKILYNEVFNNRSGNAAIYVYNSSDTTIEGNDVNGASTNNDGIKLGTRDCRDDTGTGGIIRGNTVSNTAQDSITVYISDVVVEGNTVTNSWSQNGAIYINCNTENVQVINNTLRDNNTVAIRIGQGNYTLNNISVSGNRFDNNNDFIQLGTVNNTDIKENILVVRPNAAGDSLQKALQDVVDRYPWFDTIEATAGDYIGDLSFQDNDAHKNLTLLGPKADVPGASPDRGDDAEEAVIVGSIRPKNENSGRLVDLTIKGFKIVSGGKRGINLARSNIRVENNIFVGDWTSSQNDSYHSAVYSGDTQNLVIEGNLIQGYRRGIYLDGGPNSTQSQIVNNVIRDNVTGISTLGSLYRSTGHEIRDNLIEDNSSGIVLAGRNVTDVTGVSFTVTGNVIRRNGNYGIAAGTGAYSAGDGVVKINKNVILDKVIEAADGDAPVDAQNNWWGQADGPSADQLQGSVNTDGHLTQVLVIGGDTRTNVPNSVTSVNLTCDVVPDLPGECEITGPARLSVGANTFTFKAVVEVAGGEFTYYEQTHTVRRARASAPSTGAEEEEDEELPPPLPSVSAPVTPGQPAEVQTEDGGFRVLVPAGATNRPATVSVAEVSEQDAPPPGPGMFMVAGQIFQITIEDENGQLIRQFDEPLVLTFRYDPSQLPAGATEEDLQVFYWDEDLQAWVLVPSEHDAATGTIVARVNHLTVFALIVTDLKIPSDIARHWSEDDVLKMVSLRVVTGFEDGTFRPDQPVTRAQFTTMLARAMGLQPSSTLPPFSDEIPSWAAGYVSVAVSAGLVTGYDDGTFRPDELITRQELAVMVSRALNGTGSAALNFTDADEIAEWARDAVAQAVAAGIVTGFDDGTFRPNATATRAQAAVMLSRLIIYLK